MEVLVERLSQLEQEQEMEAREFQLVVLQVFIFTLGSLALAHVLRLQSQLVA